jgi:hypothetical protein
MAHSIHGRPVPIKMTLDVSVPLEALIMKRLESIEQRRRQDWLRSILVRGFCDESATIRDLKGDEPAANRYVPKRQSLSNPNQSDNNHNAQSRRIDLPPPTPLSNAPTPLAALKSVVG